MCLIGWVFHDFYRLKLAVTYHWYVSLCSFIKFFLFHEFEHFNQAVSSLLMPHDSSSYASRDKTYRETGIPSTDQLVER